MLTLCKVILSYNKRKLDDNIGIEKGKYRKIATAKCPGNYFPASAKRKMAVRRSNKKFRSADAEIFTRHSPPPGYYTRDFPNPLFPGKLKIFEKL